MCVYRRRGFRLTLQSNRRRLQPRAMKMPSGAMPVRPRIKRPTDRLGSCSSSASSVASASGPPKPSPIRKDPLSIPVKRASTALRSISDMRSDLACPHRAATAARTRPSALPGRAGQFAGSSADQLATDRRRQSRLSREDTRRAGRGSGGDVEMACWLHGGVRGRLDGRARRATPSSAVLAHGAGVDRGGARWLGRRSGVGEVARRRSAAHPAAAHATGLLELDDRICSSSSLSHAIVYTLPCNEACGSRERRTYSTRREGQ